MGQPRRPLMFRAAAALLALVVLGVHLVRLVEPLGVDQGLFACFARWVPRGWLPYRDLFDSKPPLFLYSYALSALVPGDFLRSIWWVEAAFLAASLAAAYLIGARLWSRWAGLACAALLFAGLWSPAWGGFWSRAQAEELLVLPMLASAWLAWRSIDRVTLAVWAGVLVGVCGLYKVPSMAIAGAWMVTWLLTVRPASALRRIALLVCGVAIPWLLAVAWFAAHGALGDFATGVFVYHRYNAAFIAPPWLDVIKDFTHTLGTRAPLFLVAAGVGVYLMAARGARELRWVAPWIVFTMAAVVLQRQLAGYHYLLVVPALALAGGYAVATLANDVASGSPRARAIALACLGAVGVLAIRDGATWVEAYGPDAQALTGRLPRDAYLRRIQLGTFSMATEEDAARYLSAHSTPEEGVLVWGLSPGIYALADRHPVTRYPFHKILMTEAPLSRMWPGLPERRARFMDRVRADLPAYILIGHDDANGFEPEESGRSLQRFQPLEELVKREYRPETTVGRFAVLKRDGAAGPDPLATIHPSDAPLDWGRPLPVTPPGGLAEPGYVGTAACEGCHAKIAATFARHAMADAGLRPLDAVDAKRVAAMFDNTNGVPVKHKRSPFSYRPFRDGERYFVEERYDLPDGTSVQSWVLPVTHAFSAGSYAMAFYSRRGNRWYQMPIDYYEKLGQWDVDAGTANGEDFRFSKSLTMGCISCHGEFPRRLAGSENVFFDPVPPGVGCERCHGPGERHVASLRREDIVNPAHLSAARKIDGCAQCHESNHFGVRADRTDFSYRPGESLDAFQMSWVPEPAEPDRFILLSHPERMVESACWRGSRDSKAPLVCTTCHDPHVSSHDEPASWWDDKCIACHAEKKPCTLDHTARMAEGDHCFHCHMRRGTTSDLPLVTLTDHWIQTRPPPIRPGESATPRIHAWSSGDGPAASGADVTALESYARDDLLQTNEASRLAASAFPSKPHTPRLYRWLARRFALAGDPATAARAYGEVLRFDPDSQHALVGYATARFDEGNPGADAEGMRALDRALGVDADNPEALEFKGMALFRHGRAEEAAPLFTRAITAGTTQAASNVGLALLALRAKEPRVAATRLEDARRAEPTDAWVLDRLAEVYAVVGDRAHADEVLRARRALVSTGRLTASTPASGWLPRERD